MTTIVSYDKPSYAGYVRLVLCAMLIVLTTGLPSMAKEYVSFNGKFHITIPDHWYRADYRTVDFHLQQSTDDREVLNYEALFTPTEGGRFADDVYLLLTIDTIPELSLSQIDSVLRGLTETFGEGLKYAPMNDYLNSMKSDAPVYDAENKTVAVLTNISEQDMLVKKNLMVMKFYENGIANFYFYAPDTLYKRNEPIFASIVSSFSTGDLEAALPREELKVVDLESRQKSNQKYGLPISIFVVVMIVVIVAARRRRSRKNNVTGNRKEP